MARLIYFKIDKTISRHFETEISITQLDVFKNVELLQFRSNEETAVFAKLNSQNIQPIIISKEYQFIYEATTSYHQDSFTIAVWSEEHGERIVKYNELSELISTEIYNIDGEVHEIYLFSNTKNILVIKKDLANEINFKSLVSNEQVNFKGHSQSIYSMSVLENNNLFASSSEDRLVKIWDIAKGLCLHTIKLQDYCPQILLASKSKIIGWEGKPLLWIWDLENSNYILNNDEIYPVIVKIKYVNNNECMFVGRKDGVVDCYSLNSGKLIWSSLIKNGWVYDIESFPNKSLLAASGADGNIYLLDSQSGQLQQILVGHSGGVWNLITTSSNLITSGLDETIRVWNVQSGKCDAILVGHTHKIRQMFLTSDKKYLISIDKLGHIIAWKADWENSL